MLQKSKICWFIKITGKKRDLFKIQTSVPIIHNKEVGGGGGGGVRGSERMFLK